jgi:flagellar biosynthesis chaperone FliJ
MTGSELQFHAKRDEGATKLRLALRTRLAEIEQRRLTQMQVYLKIRQSRETLENLRNRKLEIYRVDQARREQQALDDLFLMRQLSSVEENPPKE